MLWSGLVFKIHLESGISLKLILVKPIRFYSNRIVRATVKDSLLKRQQIGDRNYRSQIETSYKIYS